MLIIVKKGKNSKRKMKKSNKIQSTKKVSVLKHMTDEQTTGGEFQFLRVINVWWVV